MSDGGADDLATLDIPARVARGAELLDEVRPGWWREIKETELRMDDFAKCVLGRLYGGFWDGMVELHRATKEPYSSLDWCRGFNARRIYEVADYDALAAAWRAEIARRVDAAAQEVTS